MEITFEVLLSFLTNYLLSVTICFIGCFVRESYNAMKAKNRINPIRLVLDSIVSGFISCCIFRVLESHFEKIFEIELFAAMCFLIGFSERRILELLTNKTLFLNLVQTMIAHTGEPGKAFVEAWKKSDEDKKEEKAKKKNNNKNVEKE